MLPTRIEESRAASGQRVAPVRLRALIAVADPTGQPEVTLVAYSAPRPRDDVFHFEPAKDVALVAETVAATIACLLSHALTEGTAKVP